MMGNCINVKRRRTFISLELEDGENSLSKAYLPDITFQKSDIIYHSLPFFIEVVITLLTKLIRYKDKSLNFLKAFLAYTPQK